VYANVRKQILFSFFCSDMLTGFSVPVTKPKDISEAKELTERLFPKERILRFDFIRESKPIAAGGSKDRYYFSTTSEVTDEVTKRVANIFLERNSTHELIAKRFKGVIENWQGGFYDRET